jgi:ribosomal protein S1
VQVINKLQETVQELNLKKEELEERNKKLNEKNMMHVTALLQSEKDRMVQLSLRDLEKDEVRDETIPLMEAKLQARPLTLNPKTLKP